MSNVEFVWSLFSQINGVKSPVVNGYHDEEEVKETPQQHVEAPQTKKKEEMRREAVPESSVRKDSPVLIVKAEVHPQPQLPDHLRKRG